MASLEHECRNPPTENNAGIGQADQLDQLLPALTSGTLTFLQRRDSMLLVTQPAEHTTSEAPCRAVFVASSELPTIAASFQSMSYLQPMKEIRVERAAAVPRNQN